jgi:GAF domain-containing protein
MLDPARLPVDELQAITADVHRRVDCHRCTLRLDVPGDYAFPVVCEALSRGVASLRSFTTLPQLEGPTFRRIRRERGLVIQNDCRAAAEGDDPEFAESYFRTLMDLYGGMAAFIAVPVWNGSELDGVISLHALGDPRVWSASEINVAEHAQQRVTDALCSVPRTPSPTAGSRVA